MNDRKNLVWTCVTLMEFEVFITMMENSGEMFQALMVQVRLPRARPGFNAPRTQNINYCFPNVI